MIDMDIDQSTPDRVITTEHLEAFLQRYLTKVKALYEVTADQVVAVATIKSDVVWKQSKGMYRDGVHLYIYFKSCRDGKKLALEYMFDELEGLFGDILPDTHRSVLDMNSKHVATLLYGSSRHDTKSKPYKVFAMWECDMTSDDIDVEEVLDYQQYSNLSEALSINAPSADIPKPHFNLRDEYIPTHEPVRVRTDHVETDLSKKVMGLIDCMPDDVAEERGPWRDIIYAIANIGDQHGETLYECVEAVTDKCGVADPDYDEADKIFNKAKTSGKRKGWAYLRSLATDEIKYAEWRSIYDEAFASSMRLAEMKQAQEDLDAYDREEEMSDKTSVVWDFDTVEPPSDGKPKYWSDLEQVCKSKNQPFDAVLKWWNGCVKLIKNGGSSFYITLDKYVDITVTDDGNTHVVSEHTAYSTIKADHLEKYIRGLKCHISNPDFDIKAVEEENSFKQRGLKIPEKARYKVPQFITYISRAPPGCASFYEPIKAEWLLESYNTVEFFPYLHKPPKLHDAVNMFTGFPLYESVKNIPVDRARPHPFESTHLYQHIKHGVCDGNDVAFDFLIKWYAHMIQRPAVLPVTMPLLVGEQGTGKSLMYKFGEMLVGDKHAVSYDNIDRFFKSFNAIKANKLFIGLEELADRGVAHAKHNQFKGELSKTHQQIEPKGIDPCKVRHCTRYMGFTNNDGGLYIENRDRRGFVVRVNGDHANDHKHFRPMFDELSNPKVCRMAFHYMAYHVDLTGFEVGSPPETVAKNDMKVAGLSNIFNFMAEKLSDDEHLKVDGHDLFAEYDEWASSRRLKVVTEPTMVKILKRPGLVKKSIKLYGKVQWGYNVTRSEYVCAMRKWLGMEEFNLDLLLI
jgi:hypothetical protein